MEFRLNLTRESLPCGERFHCVRNIQRLLEKYPGTVRFNVSVHDQELIEKARGIGIDVEELGDERYSLIMTAKQRENFLAGASKGFNLYYKLPEGDTGWADVDRLRLSLLDTKDPDVAVIEGISLIADTESGGVSSLVGMILNRGNQYARIEFDMPCSNEMGVYCPEVLQARYTLITKYNELQTDPRLHVRYACDHATKILRCSIVIPPDQKAEKIYVGKGSNGSDLQIRSVHIPADKKEIIPCFDLGLVAPVTQGYSIGAGNITGIMLNENLDELI